MTGQTAVGLTSPDLEVSPSSADEKQIITLWDTDKSEQSQKQ